AALPQLPGHRAEDAGAARVLLVVDQDQRVAVEADVAAVVSPGRLLGADDDALDHVARLDVAAGDCLFDAGNDHVSQACGAAARGGGARLAACPLTPSGAGWCPPHAG